MVDMTRRKFLGGLLASLTSVGCSPVKNILTEAQKRQKARLQLADRQGAYVLCEVNDANPSQYSEPIDKIFGNSDKIIQVVMADSKTLSVNECLDKALTQLKIGDVYKKLFIRNYGAEVFSIKENEETKKVLSLEEWKEKFQAQAKIAQKLSAGGYDKNGLVPCAESDIFWRYLNNGQGLWRRSVSSIDKKEITDSKNEAKDREIHRLLKMRSRESRVQ